VAVTTGRVEQINLIGKNTLISHLGIEFLEADDHRLVARMPVDDRTVQPMGLLHGGASAALAETLGSVGSAMLVDLEQQTPVGLELNANHIRPATTGYVTGTATPMHIGRRTHVWDIRIHDDSGRLVCTSRLTIMVVDR
jgi:1,4-dihydroxy-2-naphthoyl-CoA hydrolase